MTLSVFGLMSCKKEELNNNNSINLPSNEFYVQIIYEGKAYNFDAHDYISSARNVYAETQNYNSVLFAEIKPTFNSIDDAINSSYPFSVPNTGLVIYIPSDSSMINNFNYPLTRGSFFYEYVHDSLDANSEEVQWVVEPRLVKTSNNSNLRGGMDFNGHKIKSVEYLGRDYSTNIIPDPTLYSSFAIEGEVEANMVKKEDGKNGNFSNSEKVIFRYRVKLLVNSI